jgi:hypothetical protein
MFWSKSIGSAGLVVLISDLGGCWSSKDPSIKDISFCVDSIGILIFNICFLSFIFNGFRI